jgi:hypothetical protein
MQKPSLIVSSVLIIAAAFIAGVWLHGRAIYDSRVADTITVTGSVKKSVSSDLAKWHANFIRRASVSNLKATLDLSTQDTIKIKTFVMSYGIPEDAITFLPIQTDAVYEQSGYGQSQEVVGYAVRQELRVEYTDIAKIEQLATEAKKLIDQGIIPEYQRTEYFYTKLADLRPELFSEATKDAKKRAEAIASGTGVKVGSLRSARTGVIQILAPNSVDIADYGAYDLSTKEKEISATVSVSFELLK